MVFQQGISLLQHLCVFGKRTHICRLELTYGIVKEISAQSRLVLDYGEVLRTEKCRMKISEHFVHAFFLHAIEKKLFFPPCFLGKNTIAHFIHARAVMKNDICLRPVRAETDKVFVLCAAEAFTDGEKIYSLYHIGFALSVVSVYYGKPAVKGQHGKFYISEIIENYRFEI